MAKKKTGICKLTGKTGKFIDAHLIPKALTKPDVPGAPIIQYGAGGRPKKKWSSWKDDELVVQDGENILTESDTWAIPTLRRHQLVWSAWRRGMLDADDWTRMPGTNVGIRKIEGIWRALWLQDTAEGQKAYRVRPRSDLGCGYREGALDRTCPVRR